LTPKFDVGKTMQGVVGQLHHGGTPVQRENPKSSRCKRDRSLTSAAADFEQRRAGIETGKRNRIVYEFLGILRTYRATIHGTRKKGVTSLLLVGVHLSLLMRWLTFQG
jgi:hypothetical protein